MFLSRRKYGVSTLVFFAPTACVLALSACSDDEAPAGEVTNTPEAGPPQGRDSGLPERDATAEAPPVPTADAARTAKGIPVTVDVLANDGLAGATLRSVGNPANGTAALRDGKVTYTPNADYAGEDAFEYVVAVGDREGTGRVTVTVLPQRGTVVHGQLYTAEANDDISWAAINAQGDRVGQFEKGPNKDKIVRVRANGEQTIIEPPGPAADGTVLVRGIANDGTVVATYLHETRFQFIGFAWKDGVHDRICDLGDGAGDCTPEAVLADGRIVGTAYDYTVYTGFVWEPGKDRAPISLEGYASTYAYGISPDGTIVGVGDNSDDGYSGPTRCFRGKPGALSVLPFTDGNPHFVSCRGVNAGGLIVGGVKPLADQAGKPRSETDRMRASLYHPTKGFAYVPLPFARPTAASWRVELLLGVNDGGVMVGYFQDATALPPEGDRQRTERVTRGVTLTPVEALPGTTFADATFDHVNGPI
jgi:hypothetical protein